MPEKLIDELLEAVWSMEEEEAEEQYRAGLGEAREKKTARHQLGDLLLGRGMKMAEEEGVALGLVTGGKGGLAFTEPGRHRARELIRRHRLAERLFHDVLDVSQREMESSACKLEHILSHQATNSVCILLGHPTTCPHDRPIPRGECCRQGLADVRPLAIRASQLRKGEEAMVAYIGTREESRMEKLAILGILPGSRIRLEQRRPSYILRVDETQLGLDDAIVEEIFVRHLP
jgi:DtxR family Mn-dependent transcriptional regulator